MKKIVFISNYLTHHQIPFCDEMCRQKNIEFVFISTTKFSQQREALGWKNNAERGYFLEYKPDEENTGIKIIIDDADVVIIGSAPNKLVSYRIKNNKPVFRYSERPLKKGIELKKYPFRFVKWRIQNPQNKKIYMLCASGYTASDYKKFGLFKNRTYKWGYFPETKEYSDTESLMKSKKDSTILWCGRFVGFKHIENAIELAKNLCESGYDFSLEIIGDGDNKEELEKLIKQYGIAEKVKFLGAMSTEKVREYMEQAGIYIMTSDRGEGWGAVVNEAMNSCCAVVASNLAGSVPYLIKNGINGLVYQSGDVGELTAKVEFLLDNPSEQKRLGQAAYDTITEIWNARIAAERFVNLANHITDGEQSPDLYSEGPCSRA